MTIRPNDTGGFSIDAFTVTPAVGGNDVDSDGVPDGDDLDPGDPFVCADDDGDGCDDCSVAGFQDASDDGPDLDGDGLCDAGDGDIDGDTVPNGDDPDPTDGRICGDSDEDTCDDCWIVGLPSPELDGVDTDGDGICNAGDDDMDGDTIPNEADPAPLDSSVCGDSDGDTCDDCRITNGPPDPNNDGADTDGDGTCDAAEGGDPNLVIIDLRSPSVALDDSLVICGRSGNAVAMFINRNGFNFSRGPNGFGIDGLATNELNRIDGGEIVEIQFNYDARWEWIEILTDSVSDCGSVEILGGTPTTICGSDLFAVGGGTVIPRTAPNDQRSVRLRAVGGAAVSLERIAFVPLPAQSIIDLQLDVDVSNSKPMLGEQITVSFEAENIGPADADNVSAQIDLPAGLELSSVSAAAGTSFNPENGVWTIGHLETGFRFKGEERKSLNLVTTVRPDSGEVFSVSGEISGALQADEDSTPGNGIVDEDDDDTKEIDILRPEDIPEPPNPLLLALLNIFTCGAVGSFTSMAVTIVGIVGMRVRSRKRRRRR